MEMIEMNLFFQNQLMEIAKRYQPEYGLYSEESKELVALINELEEKAKAENLFLHFSDVFKKLTLSGYEKLLLGILFQKEVTTGAGMDVSKIWPKAGINERNPEQQILSSCFVLQGRMVQLSPVILSYLKEEYPVLPDGIKLSFPKEEMVYGSHSLLAESLSLLQEEFAQKLEQENLNLAIVISGQEGSGRHFLLEQIVARMLVPLCIITASGKKYTQRERNEIIFLVLFFQAFLCIEAGEVSLEEVVCPFADFIPMIAIIKEKNRIIKEYIGYSQVVKEIPMPDMLTKREIMQAIFQNTDGETTLPAGLTKNQLSAKQMPTAEYIRYLNNIKMEIMAGGTNLHAIVNRTNSLHLNMIPATRTFDELKLPPMQYQQLFSICNMIEAREKVMEEWGFGNKFSYGNGMSVLFYGAPGTGKTMAAQVMANRLGLPLLRVDLSQVTSKYIGETQKNIGKIFNEADKCECILLFDEADAIFTKRSDVSDAQDKYSNAETAYLLQRIEQYSGVSILATNLLQNFDDAFRRRISYMVHFPMPDEKLRMELWSDIFPKQAMLDENIDFLALSQAFELSGAAIKNAALHAAYVAMAEQCNIAMAHILQGIQNEYSKIGKSMNEAQKELINIYRGQ